MLSPRGPTELNEPRVANQAAVKLSSAVLSSAHVFDKLAPTELELLVSNSDLCEFPRGDVLVHEGDPSDILYFVVSGRFCARNERTGDVFGEVGPGQPVGEIGFFSNIARTATVTALRDFRFLPSRANASSGSEANCLASGTRWRRHCRIALPGETDTKMS